MNNSTLPEGLTNYINSTSTYEGLLLVAIVVLTVVAVMIFKVRVNYRNADTEAFINENKQAKEERRKKAKEESDFDKFINSRAEGLR